MKKDLLTLKDVNHEELAELLELAADVKQNRAKYAANLAGKTLLMIFEKPSLRTRLSFDVGIKQLGGFGIVMDATDAPLGAKETIEDTARASSRYVDAMMARMFEHSKVEKLAEHATVPVVNGLTNDFHPCQILSDLLTIKEKKGCFDGIRLCFVGDGLNNICHSLLIGCALAGIDIAVGCPEQERPKAEVVAYARSLNSNRITITSDPKEAVDGADIVYADTWMSYHIKPEEKLARIQVMMPYQVNADLVQNAKSDFIFMNCLPAIRGEEQTAEIIDGPNSIVFDQAENRLHMQKAIMLKLMAGR